MGCITDCLLVATHQNTPDVRLEVAVQAVWGKPPEGSAAAAADLGSRHATLVSVTPTRGRAALASLNSPVGGWWDGAAEPKAKQAAGAGTHCLLINTPSTRAKQAFGSVQ